jgi:DNA-directed RNA polymerase sigma subunit (sigma70/sigma32)
MASLKDLKEELRKVSNYCYSIDEYIWEKIKKNIGKMPRRTYWILRYRHRDKMSLEDIAKEYQVSRERIWQIIIKGEELLDQIIIEADDFVPKYKIDKYE